MADIEGVTHIGVTVDRLDVAVDFWSAVLGTAPIHRRVYDGAYLSNVTDYEGVSIDVAEFRLPGGGVLELCEYLTEVEPVRELAPAVPGTAHLALRSGDIRAVWARAIAAGGRPISPGPVPITSGPNTGRQMAYIAAPGGVILEISTD